MQIRENYCRVCCSSGYCGRSTLLAEMLTHYHVNAQGICSLRSKMSLSSRLLRCCMDSYMLDRSYHQKGWLPCLRSSKTGFGRCPRVYCCGQPCLPVGQSAIPRTSTVKIYCPKCEDIYYPRSKYQGNIDGAYFGTTIPHLFLLTYEHLKPQKPPSNYDSKDIWIQSSQAMMMPCQ